MIKGLLTSKLWPFIDELMSFTLCKHCATCR